MKLNSETTRKSTAAPKIQALAALIELLGERLAPDGRWQDRELAWHQSVTTLLRLCAIRLTHPQHDWGALISEFSVLLSSPTTLNIASVEKTGELLDSAMARAVDAVLLDLSVSRTATDAYPVTDFAQDIARIYEAVLTMVPAFEKSDHSGFKLRARIRDRSRKRGGSFYSPPHLVSRVVEEALGSVAKTATRNGNSVGSEPCDFTRLRIVDPAMGAGVFLIQALKFLNRHSDIEAETIARNVLYGVDLDQLAVEAARLSMWTEVANYALNPSVDFPNLRVGNSLIGCRIDQVRDEKGSGVTKDKLDSWCASWFQNLDRKSLGLSSGNENDGGVDEGQKFFHWEFEFPEVFSKTGSHSGFDLVIGNPPWEIEKPNSREFFGAVLPDYWTLGKQEAIAAQKQLLGGDPELAADWRARQEEHKRFAQWVRKAPVQCTDEVHPFLCQGAGDTNLYKLFCEQAFYLARPGGCVALVVPSGIYSDCGARDLRRLLIERNVWTKLVGFENSDRTFDIHRSFKYCFFVATSGGTTSFVETEFGGEICRQGVSTIGALSPKWSVLPEVENHAAFSLIEKIYSSADLLGSTMNGGFQLEYKREFDMTLDSHLFRERDQLEEHGYLQDCYGNWLSGGWHKYSTTRTGAAYVPDEEQLVVSSSRERFIHLNDVESVFIPLYEGRMLGQFNSNEKRWISGRGRRAVWLKTEGAGQGAGCRIENAVTSSVGLGPQYLVSKNNFLQRCSPADLKIGFLAVGSATNARTMIATALSAVACGNSVPILKLQVGSSDNNLLSPLEYSLALIACLNSFVFDFVIRRKMAGNNLNYFVIEECPVPVLNEENAPLWRRLAILAGELALNDLRYCRELLAMGLPLEVLQASDRAVLKRQQRRVLVDLIVAKLYDLNSFDMGVLLHNSSDGVTKSQKGFHRMDRDLSSELRLPGMVSSRLALLDATQQEFEVEVIGAHSKLITLPASAAYDLEKHARLLNNLVQ